MKSYESIMNNDLTKQESDILCRLTQKPYVSQRELSEACGYSLGIVNRSLRALSEYGLLDEACQPTAAASKLFASHAPRNAVILAAGFGMRMVPINLETPKAFLEVHGEALIERLIKQLREAGVTDITVVVGFMKESFDYLIDAYGVQLVFNPDYASKNNLASLALVADRIANTYIIPCDVWCRENPFRKNELYSWYMVSDGTDSESGIRVNRKLELVTAPKQLDGNTMIGISYLLAKDGALLRERLLSLNGDPSHDGSFWEAALMNGDRMSVTARIVPAADVIEINTYEQLRELDSNSNQLRSDALDVIAGVFHTRPENITDISVLKKGMTNRSFLFSVSGNKYIMRIPGEGTDQLISREHEAAVFRAISGLGLCDDPVYIDPESGYKITKYLDGIRVADPQDASDQETCMKKLRAFHEMDLKVDHVFDLFGQIEFYESLWEGRASIYKDYAETKKNVLSLQDYINGLEKPWSLTHIDAVPDNFLFYKENGSEMLQLTDWEYAGMQDPHLDIAMWSIYSFYTKEQIDRLIDLYFENSCGRETRAKIYCYVSAAGLLWSNWCEYKAALGVEFGEYAMKQYRFAKDFYRFAKEAMEAQQ